MITSLTPPTINFPVIKPNTHIRFAVLPKYHKLKFRRLAIRRGLLVTKNIITKKSAFFFFYYFLFITLYNNKVQVLLHINTIHQ